MIFMRASGAPLNTPTARASASRTASCRAILLAGGIIVLAALAAYYNTLSGPLIFDDLRSITRNPTIRQLWPPWSALSPPRGDGSTVSGRPLVNLSLAVNYAAGGTAVRGYHVLNLAIHVLAGLTLFGIMRRTLLLGSGQALPLALTVALLWTLHPLQTEAVTYVVQRAESLMGLCYLLTLYCFIRGVNSTGASDGAFEETQGRRDFILARRRFRSLRRDAEDSLRDAGAPRKPEPDTYPIKTEDSASRRLQVPAAGIWYALSIMACLAGMATKEVMVSAPLLVLLYDRTFVAGSFREAWRRRRWFYLGLAGTWLLLGWLVAGTGGRGGTAGFGAGITGWEYSLTQFQAIVHYLQLSLWPDPLIIDYGIVLVDHAAAVAPFALVVVLLVAGTVAALRYRPVLGLVGVWFLAILAPTSSVVPVADVMFDHRMYLPLAAVVALLACGIYALSGRRSLIVGLALAVGLGGLTARRNEDYRSELALWRATVAKRPGNPRVHNNLGIALMQAGRADEAMTHYATALQIAPEYPDAHNNLGLALFQAGRIPEAVGHYEAALRLKPDYAEAHFNLGNARLQAGLLPEAAEHYEAALRLRPDYAEAHCNLGTTRLQSGRTEAAIGHYEAALRLKPDYADAHYNLAEALVRTGRVAEGIRHYEEVLRLRPGDAEARATLDRLRPRPPATDPKN
jgi:Flp pilus assembly protein TadD